MSEPAKDNSRPTWGVLPDIQGNVTVDELMARHTSFGIGGFADVFASPDSVDDLQKLLKWARVNSVPVLMIGAGCNLLVSDKGIRGLVIRLGHHFSSVNIQGTTVIAGASVKLPRLVKTTLDSGLSGMEGLAGVPGTVGGAISMNAGTPKGCIKDSLKSVKALDKDLNLVNVQADDLGLRYRGSQVKEKELIILEAEFSLSEVQTPEEAERVEETAEFLRRKRMLSQPVGVKTCGSVFKNPESGFAGQMLEEISAKGLQIGGARVSEVHANFIENFNHASAEDIRRLIDKLQRMVNERFGVMLEPEVRIMGEW